MSVVAEFDRNTSILLLIGKLNYSWTNTESLLIYVIAHLLGTDKEAAIIVFLTLNTTRARMDLVERLLKLGRVDTTSRLLLGDVMNRMKSVLKVRNKYNHCVYSFDRRGDFESTQLLRIADHGDELRFGKVERIDAAETKRIADTIAEIVALNGTLLEFLARHSVKL